MRSEKRVIYVGFNDERQFIVDYLYEKHQWEPVLFVGSDRMLRWSEENYPDAVLLYSMKLRQAKFDYGKVGVPVPIDADLIEVLSKYELNFLGILEDTNGWNYSFAERKRFYYDMLRYWNTVIHRFKPNLFVSFTWPHTPTCYSLYLVCKYHFSIDVLFLDPVPLLNRKYHLIGSSLEALYAQFIKLYASDEPISLDHDVQKYLTRVRSKEGMTPQYITDVYDKSTKESQIFRLKLFIRLILSTLLKGTGFKKAMVAWKKNRKPYYLPDSRMNHLEYFLFVELLRNKNKKLQKYYRPLCVEPDFKKKYLYFAAPYQPEAVTGTNAGVYVDLFLVLDILSSVLPEDWVIYYKENPTTFDRSPWAKGALRRDKYYFQRVNAYKKVQLVSFDISTFKLIDGAQAVATVSGTVAWEAAVRGKPALSFGSAWYMGCKSIFWIKTLQDARDAMKKIVNGYTPDQADIERYAAAIEKVAVKGMIHRNFDENIKKCKDPKYEMERIGKALYKAYERHYGT